MRLSFSILIAFIFTLRIAAQEVSPMPCQGGSLSSIASNATISSLQRLIAGETCGCYTAYTDDGTFNGKVAADLAHSPAVFAGEVINIHLIQHDLYDGINEITFKVSRNWKNVDGGLVRVLAEPKRAAIAPRNDSNRGISFELGESYLVFAEPGTGNGLWASACTRTKRLLDAKDDLAALGEGQPPSTNVARIEIDGKPVTSDYHVFFRRDGAWAEAKRLPHGFLAPDFLADTVYFDVLFTFDKEHLEFDHLGPSAILNDWVVGVDRKPFSEEFVDPAKADSIKRVYYLRFEGFEAGAQFVVSEPENLAAPTH